MCACAAESGHEKEKNGEKAQCNRHSRNPQATWPNGNNIPARNIRQQYLQVSLYDICGVVLPPIMVGYDAKTICAWQMGFSSTGCKIYTLSPHVLWVTLVYHPEFTDNCTFWVVISYLFRQRLLWKAFNHNNEFIRIKLTRCAIAAETFWRSTGQSNLADRMEADSSIGYGQLGECVWTARWNIFLSCESGL